MQCVYYAIDPDASALPRRRPVASDCTGTARQEVQTFGMAWAEQAAEDYHNRSAGAAVFPAVVALYDGKDGPEIGRFDVDREAVPVFRCRGRVA
jgi:hypothetical protein